MRLKRNLCFWIAQIATVVLIVNSAYCAVYYVRDNGNDSSSGLSDAAAWKTIQKVNSFAFKDGDTVRFKRGDVFDDKMLTLDSSSPDNFTIEDYGSGSKPLFDGNVIHPIVIIKTNMRNLTIRNIDISGQDWAAGKAANISINYINGVTIDGVIGNGHAGGNRSDGKNAIFLGECSGTVEIKNCNLYNWGPDPIMSLPDDYNAIVVYKNTSGTIKIHDNILHDINADGIVLLNTKTSTKIYNNTIYNCGENTIDFKGSSYAEAYNNTLYREPDFNGQINSSSPGVLIMVHGNVASSPEEAEDNIIRDNYLKGGDQGAIVAGVAAGTYGVDGLDIRGNKFENCAGVLSFGKLVKNVNFSGNRIINPIHDASGDSELGSIFVHYTYDTGSGNSGINISDNRFYSTKSTMRELIFLGNLPSGTTTVKGNTAYSASASATYLFRWTGAGVKPSVSGNSWYHAKTTKRVTYGARTYSSNQLSQWINDGHPGAQFNENINISALIGVNPVAPISDQPSAPKNLVISTP